MVGRFVDRRSVRSAHIKRSDNLTRARSYSDLRFDRQAAAIAKACNYDILALRNVQKLLTDETATVAHSIAARLYYCNAVLYGTPGTMLNKLQRVQNNLARVVCRCGGQADARLLLRSLHWLPLNQRITYKVAVLTYKLRSTSTPPYHSTLLQPMTSSCSLRSVDSFRLQVQRTRTEFGRWTLILRCGTDTVERSTKQAETKQFTADF